MGLSRIVAIALMVLGFAAPADAGVQLYSGEIIVHMRGSDAAGDFIGIPFGRHCNTRPYRAEHTDIFYQSAKTYSLTIPKFGGQVPVIDTNSDSIPDVASGCAPASRQAGLPLTGSGALATTGTTSTEPSEEFFTMVRISRLCPSVGSPARTAEKTSDSERLINDESTSRLERMLNAQAVGSRPAAMLTVALQIVAKIC